WRRRGRPVRSPILAAAARMAAVLPSISVAVGRRMAAVDQRAVAAGDRMGVAVAAKASISAGSPGPERTPATQAFIEHRAPQRRRIRAVVATNQHSRSAM